MVKPIGSHCHSRKESSMVRQPLHVRANDKQPGEQSPPLEPGDRLTRDEFERRYEAMPWGIKAELLEGVVHIPSPTRFRRHGMSIVEVMHYPILR